MFLDRDGTIIVEKNYLRDPNDVCLEAGAVVGLRRLQVRGHPLIVISNQSGIARGRMLETDVLAVNRRVGELLLAHGIKILAWYFCPHGPDSACACRKPAPGMALRASRDLNLDLAGAFVVGDKDSDLKMADAIGATGILVATGHGNEYHGWAVAMGRVAVPDLDAAAAHIEMFSNQALAGRCL